MSIRSRHNKIKVQIELKIVLPYFKLGIYIYIDLINSKQYIMSISFSISISIILV